MFFSRQNYTVFRHEPKGGIVSSVDAPTPETIVEIHGVKYHRHENGGGLVAETATVDPTEYVGPNAWVHDRAQVLDLVRIEDKAEVRGNTRVTARAKVCGSSIVDDTAQIGGSVEIHNLIVRGDTQLLGSTVFWAEHQGFYLNETARDPRP